MNKKFVSLLISSAMILSSLPMALADNSKLVTSVKNVDGKITVEGIGEKKEAVNIFLLNPDKTVADLNEADTDAEFADVVNYADVVYTGSDKLFKHTFEINNLKDGEEYLLYVKTQGKSYELELAEVNIYVSKSGTDSGDGTEANPFNTIEKAKAYAATLSNANPKNIIIDEGEYTFTSGLKFTSADSGTANAPVTYKAKDGAKVVISGAKKLDVTDTNIFKPVTDPVILAQLPDAVEDKVVEIDLAEAGLTEVANFMAAHDSNTTTKNKGKENERTYNGTRVEPMGVYLNGDLQEISQWPNKTSEHKRLVPAEKSSDLTISLEGVDAEKVSEWSKADNLYLDGIFRRGWYRESAQVEEIKGNTFTLKVQPYDGVLCKKHYDEDGNEIDPVPTDTRIVVKNLLEEIDVPGEWYINKEATKMYYYAPYTLTPSDTFEIGALTDSFVNLKDCDYVTFDGIEFTKNATFTNDATENIYFAAIKANASSEGLVVKNCTIKDVGGMGIFAEGTQTTITGNTIQNISEDGIRVWNKDSVTTLNDPKIKISNNSISNVGMNITSSAMCGVTIWGAYGAIVKNNTVRNVPTTGIIDNGGPANQILNNEIYNVCEYSLDAGAIYKGRSYVGYGFKVKNNYIHDVGPAVKRDKTHITGIYLDDLYSGGTVEGNIIDVDGEWQTYGIINCAGVDNTIKDNVVVNAKLANIAVTTRPNIEGLTPQKFAQEQALADPATGKYHKQFYYNTNAAFATFLQATDYVATGATAEEKEANRRFAVMNIGKEGGPNWLPHYVDAYPEVMENYAKLVVGDYSKSDKVINNVTGGATPADGHVHTPAALAANVTGNTVTNNVEGTISDKLASITDGVGASADVLANTEKDFNLVYPTNEAAIKTNSTYIKWQKSDFADKYEYKVYTNANLTGEPAYSGIVEENYAELTNLAADTTYYWTVTAISESRLIDETTHRAKQVNSFKTTTYEFSPSYDATGGRIAVKGTNNGEAKTVMMIAAVKVGGEMKAATTLSPNLNFVNGYDDTAYLTVTDEMKAALKETGAELELYIWDTDMKSLTGKTKLN